MADITIGIVASAREWRSILQAHVRDHVAGVRVQILREPRMALELDLDVVVIDDVSSFLTRDKVVRLREKGTRVVGIYDPDGQEGLGISFLENLGVDLSLPSNISPEEMINAVSQLQPRENYSHTFDHVVADYTSSGISAPTGESTLIAVGGPAGTGSTEVAIGLADVLVSRRQATLLLDVDEVGPSVARRLGYHLHPNILSAIDTVNNVTRPLTEMVGRVSDRGARGIHFDVIPGIANPEDWAQLRSMDMDDLFSATRKSWRYVICNTGPFAEDLSGYGIERFASTRSTLKTADVIIGVMTPTPTGYLRFLDWMVSLRTIDKDQPVFVVVNNVGKSSYIRGEIESQLTKDIDPRYLAGIFYVPSDDKVTKAEWEGQLVSKGAFVTAIAQLASYVVPMEYTKNKKKQVQQGYSAQPQNTGYVPQIAGDSPSASVSWDDPDIAYPTEQQQAPSVEQDFFNSAHPLEGNPITHIDPSQNNTATQGIPEGYVPVYKRDDQVGTPYTSGPQTQLPQQDSSQPSPSPQPQQQGYVPHFVEEAKTDEDENFWGGQ